MEPYREEPDEAYSPPPGEEGADPAGPAEPVEAAEPPALVLFGYGVTRRALAAIVIGLVLAAGLIVWVNVAFGDAVTGVTAAGRSKWSRMAEQPGALGAAVGWTTAANLSWPIPVLNVVVPAVARWRLAALTPGDAVAAAADGVVGATINFPRPPV